MIYDHTKLQVANNRIDWRNGSIGARLTAFSAFNAAAETWTGTSLGSVLLPARTFVRDGDYLSARIAGPIVFPSASISLGVSYTVYIGQTQATGSTVILNLISWHTFQAIATVSSGAVALLFPNNEVFRF